MLLESMRLFQEGDVPVPKICNVLEVSNLPIISKLIMQLILALSRFSL